MDETTDDGMCNREVLLVLVAVYRSLCRAVVEREEILVVAK